MTGLGGRQRDYRVVGQTFLSAGSADIPVRSIQLGYIAFLVLICLLLAPPTFGQESVDRFERTMSQIQRQTQGQVDTSFPLNQRALVDYGGYFTFGYLSFDDANHDNHALRDYELVYYGRLNIDGVHEFYARGRSFYRNYNPGDVIDDTADRLQGRVEEGWYRFDLQRYESAYKNTSIPDDLWIKGGRQFVSWGNGLTLDQYVDGIYGEFRLGNRLIVDGLACVTARETIDFDLSRPNFFDDTHRGYYGATIALPLGKHRPYAFFLGERDYNSPEPLNAHIIPTRYLYNSFYTGIGINGGLGDKFAYAGEVCFEGGNTLSNSFDPSNNQPIAQTNDRIQAWAADVRLDYLPNDRRRSRASIEGVIATGDPGRVNTSATFGGPGPNSLDRAYNGLGIKYAGLAFAPQVSNLLMLHIGGSTYPFPTIKPFRELQTGADFFVYGKTNLNAPIEEPTLNKRYIGCEPDVFVNWQVAEDVTLAVRYGLFFPGDAIPSGNANHVRQFLYSGVTYAF